MYFNTYDILSAYFLFGQEYNLYQDEKISEYMERVLNLGYKPHPLLGYRTLSKNGQEIFDNLVSKLDLNKVSRVQ